MKPNFTPREATVALDAAGPRADMPVIEYKGYRLEWDGGPMMSPLSHMGPTVSAEGLVWFASGEPGDPVTDETYWILVSG